MLACRMKGKLVLASSVLSVLVCVRIFKHRTALIALGRRMR